MRRMMKFFRLSEDEDSKQLFKSPFYTFVEMISHVEEYPYDTFDEKFPGPKCYVYFTDGRIMVFLDKADRVASIVNGTHLAHATGRNSLINSQ